MAAAAKIKASGASQCAYTTGWPSWVHVENLSAWHNVPIGTKENGMGGLDTTFQINSPLHVRHWNNLKDWNSKGYFTYAGRRNEGGSEVLQRRMRDADVVLGGAGEHQPQREVQVRRRDDAVLRRRRRARRRTRSSAAHRCG